MMLEPKHVTKDGTLIYQDGSEIGLTKIISKFIDVTDEASLKNLISNLDQLLVNARQKQGN